MSKKGQNKPEWNDRFYETKDYKASKAELLQKKISLVSKNRKAAKEEWRRKQEALKKGKVPQEYKEYLGPKQKKYTAKSNFLHDRSLYDEYQNRFRADSGPRYVPMKKVNHKMMNREVQENEERFMKALQHDTEKQTKKPQGRQRPITSTHAGNPKKKQVIDYAEESDEEQDINQSIRTYDNYNNREYKFNKDLDDTSTNQSNIHNNQDEDIDDVIGLMNEPKRSETNIEANRKFTYQPKLAKPQK